MTRSACRRGAFALATVLVAGTAVAVQPKEDASYLDSKQYLSPEVNVSTSNVPVEELLGDLPNRAAWEAFLAAQSAAGEPVAAYVEPRSGATTSMLVRVPLIPGTGLGNRISKAVVERALGRSLESIDAQAVVDLVRRYAEAHKDILGIDVSQLGPGTAAKANENLWHVNFPQVHAGVPVRYGRLAANISYGNLVLIGSERWADVKAKRLTPAMNAEQALEAGFGYAGGRSALDELVTRPTLELVPYAPAAHQVGEAFGGPVGAGVQHYLAWKFSFSRPPEQALWEVLIEANTGRVLFFEDQNQYAAAEIKGGIYPLTNTGVCPNNQTCGTMQPNHPMPFGDTGFAPPDNFTNSAGVYDYSSGSVTTTFNGQFVRMTDTCGAMNQSSATGTLNLGGATGDHDCAIPAGASVGNTAASRSGFYELNKLIEQAKGYLPGNAWLGQQLTANMNINQTCNAFWGGGTVNFYRSGGGCGNTGEIAAVFDHEWGHGLDDNDTLGTLSTSSEGYADVASIYRLQASCVGHGFSIGAAGTCGLTSDGTGPNRNEAQTGPSHCDTDCSGVRDSDWAKHVDNTPDTVAFVCSSCLSGSSLCGRQTHCAATPTRQAAWDLPARDLQAPPFSYDSQTAFIVANKVFYQGSGNIGNWHSCTCPSTSDGCGATNGYMQWLAADDDNGNLADGTPHMTAIHAAFNRHNIACATPTPANSGCAAGPTAASTLTASGGTSQVGLSWSGVANAERYWVFRSEGYAGCDFGKTLIADVDTTAYTDTQVANGRPYYYNVVAVDGATAGVGKACYGRASNCANATPVAGPDFSVSCAPGTLTIWEGESRTATCTVTSSASFSAGVTLSCPGAPAGVTCGFVPPSVTPPANGTVDSALTVTLDPSILRGNYALNVQGTNAGNNRTTTVNLNVVGYGTDRHSRFDLALQVPRCFNWGRACDTGTLVGGRDTISGGNEPNQPNTIGDSCADGTSGTFHVDESNDVLRVFSEDGQVMAPGGQITVEAKAWVTDFTQDRADFYFAPDAALPVWSLIGTVTPAANGLQLLSINHTLPAGTHVSVRVRFRRGGSAAPCGAGAFDDHDDLIFRLGVPAVMAAWDPALQAPRCTVVGKSCDSGPTLLLGRDTITGGPEVNQPNTINDSCADGTSGTFHGDESIDRLKVETLGGGPFAAGASVRVTATVWVWTTPSSDHLELFFAPNANAPSWTKIGATITPGTPGLQTFTADYVLPAGGLQAIRGHFRFNGSDGACVPASFSDFDDLIFAVQ